MPPSWIFFNLREWKPAKQIEDLIGKLDIEDKAKLTKDLSFNIYVFCFNSISFGDEESRIADGIDSLNPKWLNFKISQTMPYRT